MPVLGRVLNVHDLRHDALLRAPRSQDAVLAAAERIALLVVSERKHVGGEQMIGVLRGVPRRLGEAVVEEAEPAAGNVRNQPVEHLPSLLIGVEALVGKHSQAAAALRDAEADRRARSPRRRRRRAGSSRSSSYFRNDTRSRIAASPEPLHHRIAGFVDHFVDVAAADARGHDEFDQRQAAVGCRVEISVTSIPTGRAGCDARIALAQPAGERGGLQSRARWADSRRSWPVADAVARRPVRRSSVIGDSRRGPGR